MAKSTKARPVARGTKGASSRKRAGGKPAGKGVRAASQAKGTKRAAPKAKKAVKGKGRAKASAGSRKTTRRIPATRVEASAMPRRASSKAAARRAVARPTKAHHEAQMERAEADHQDPRLAGIPGIGPEGSKVQADNYGAFKVKAVARLDKPTNWFRRGAKPKS
jgi:hypothetical protein